MPASEFNWSPVNQFSSFSVVGRSKRKAACETQEQIQQFEEQQVAAKRLCLWPDSASCVAPPPPPTTQPDEQAAVDMDDMETNEATEINQNYMQSVESLHAQVEMLASSVHSEVLSANHILGIPQMKCGAGIMDLCDGTYNTHAADIPIPCYQTPPITQPPTNCPHSNTAIQPTLSTTPPHTESAANYCKEFCGAGDGSPRSGRVRCYCKPSWEGMLDTRPYVSDVY